MENVLLLLALGAPAVAALAIFVGRPGELVPGRIAAAGCGVATLASLALVVWSATRSDGVVGDGSIGGLAVGRTSAVLLAAVTATGAVVASFARRNVDVDPRAPRFFVAFSLLVSSSALVIAPGQLWLAMVGWIVSGWALVDLVGADSRAGRTAQRRVARVLGIGDIAFVVAVVTATAAGAGDLTSDTASAIASLRAFDVIALDAWTIVALAIVVAGVSRSSLVPLHRWLIASLAAPTPVSALVHAGVVSGAGLLLIRFRDVVLDGSVPIHLAFAVAVVTVVAATLAGATRVDVKGKLAWSTIAQMGFMVLQCAVGAFSSALVHIVGHGMYKASMFLGAGDAIGAAIRSRRSAAPVQTLDPVQRAVASILITSIVVGVGLVVITPDVVDAGVVLIAVFAWLTVAHGVSGWLGRGALARVPSLAVAVAGAVVSTGFYLGGLRALEAFLAPSFSGLDTSAAVGTDVLLVTLAAVALFAILVAVGARGSAVGEPVRVLTERFAHPELADSIGSGRPVSPDAAIDDLPVPTDDAVRQAQIRVDVNRASRLIAPMWPLTSFVAVNPLGGLEGVGFDEATHAARERLHAKTHLTLAEYRSDHGRGLTTLDDVRQVIRSRFAELSDRADLDVAGRPVAVVDIVMTDLLHGPEAATAAQPRTSLERIEGVLGPVGEALDLIVFHAAARHMAASQGSKAALSFRARWRRDATGLSGLRPELSPTALRWIDALGDDPAAMIDAALALLGIDDDARVAELEGHLVRLQGWAGVARWRSEWAHPDEWRPPLSLLDLAAARCVLEAAWFIGRSGLAVAPVAESADVVDERVRAVMSALGASSPVDAAAVRAVVEQVPDRARHAIWLDAQERHRDREILAALDGANGGGSHDGVDAQLVFCIDVRSEGFRRQIERAGAYETRGFAGFFGVPMNVQRLEWEDPEPRCPVLVAPSVPARERPLPGAGDTDPRLRRSRAAAAFHESHRSAKLAAGAPFALAEAAGWLAGPVAAWRTFAPKQPRPVEEYPTVVELASDRDGGSVEQRTDIAEAVLTTMGLVRDFAPLVVLCGHASDNVNNAHATALDCGACAGASGLDNSRAVATLLNERGVRGALRERGIDVPDDTHFMAGLHETVSDRVDLVDLTAVPPGLAGTLDRLRDDLETAARAQSVARSAALPGPTSGVRRRGADWAQVRPEWGLARNSAFIIGPRSITSELDLGGRAFLHSYDAAADPDGRVLETIMTAPLVVGHWISSQYYFSTVDSETFGAGDKLVHNVVGDVGVMSGGHGDLRVGLPRQSTHLGDQRHHQPLRLLAVVEAPIDTVERIIGQNPVLTTLIGGSWIRLAARRGPGDPWSTRSADGTWTTERFDERHDDQPHTDTDNDTDKEQS